MDATREDASGTPLLVDRKMVSYPYFFISSKLYSNDDIIFYFLFHPPSSCFLPGDVRTLFDQVSPREKNREGRSPYTFSFSRKRQLKWNLDAPLFKKITVRSGLIAINRSAFPENTLTRASFQRQKLSLTRNVSLKPITLPPVVQVGIVIIWRMQETF